MGNLGLCCSNNAELNRLFLTLQIANRNSLRGKMFSPLLQQYRSDLEALILRGKNQYQTFGGLFVQVVPFPKYTQTQEIIKQKQFISVKLIIMPEKQSTAYLQKNKKIIYSGSIIFSDAYYVGEILNGKAQGFGTIFYQCMHLYGVQGQWKNDILVKGIFYKLIQTEDNFDKEQQFQIELLNGEREAIIRVKKKFTYKGSIRLTGSKSIKQILTGEGVINFSNGDKYQGQLVNGLFQTSKGKAGKYTYAKGIEMISFQGYFKSGMRHDRGTLNFQIKRKQQKGIPCNLCLNFFNGAPNGLGILCCEDHYSVSVEVKNQQIKINQKISELNCSNDSF